MGAIIQRTFIVIDSLWITLPRVCWVHPWVTVGHINLHSNCVGVNDYICRVKMSPGHNLMFSRKPKLVSKTMNRRYNARFVKYWYQKGIHNCTNVKIKTIEPSKIDLSCCGVVEGNLDIRCHNLLCGFTGLSGEMVCQDPYQIIFMPLEIDEFGFQSFLELVATVMFQLHVPGITFLTWYSHVWWRLVL